MLHNLIKKRSTTLLGLLTAAIAIGGFFIYQHLSNTADGPVPRVGDSVNVADEMRGGSEYRAYDERLSKALSLQRSLTVSADERSNWNVFESEKYKFQFQYPSGYLVMDEEELNPSENAGAIFRYSLIEDNERNQNYLLEHTTDAEPPAGISIIIYSNDPSIEDLSGWVPPIVTEDQKEIPGIYEKVFVSEQEALLYTTSTMYEYDFVLVKKNNYIYNFNVGFTGPEDQIRTDFYRSLTTLLLK